MLVFSHVLYFFHVRCLCVGAVGLTLSFMLHARTKGIWLRFFLIFVVTFFVLMVFQTLRYFYNLADFPWGGVVNRVLLAFNFVALDVFVYLIPFFATWLTGKKWRGAQALFTTLAGAYLVLLALYSVFFYGNIFVYGVMVVIFAFMLIYSVSVILKGRNSIRDPRMRSLCLYFVILSLVFCPLAGFDAFMPFLRFRIAPILLSGALAFPLYYLWFNILALVYLIPYFASLPQHDVVQAKNSAFERYKISGREREIIDLIGQGLTYKEISDRLHISAHTVNNHVAHVYAKTGARNRVDLLRELARG